MKHLKLLLHHNSTWLIIFSHVLCYASIIYKYLHFDITLLAQVHFTYLQLCNILAPFISAQHYENQRDQKADDSTDKLRECDSDKIGVGKT